MKRLICFFLGHKPESHATVTPKYIYTKRCKRCHKPCWLPYSRNLPPPPGVVVEEWKKFIEEKETEIINKCSED